MRRRGRARSVSQVRTWLVATLAIVLLSAIIGAGAYLNFTKRSTDRATGCPTDQYDSTTAVLIDLTDPISPTQAAALRNVLTKIRNGVPRYGRLEVYPLKSVATETIAPLFEGCSPGSGKEVDNRFYGNPELADRIWRRSFADKVDVVISDLLKLSQQENSPIFEGVQSVAVTAFGVPIARDAPHKHLVVISDMIHHTRELSMYQGAPSFDHVRSSQYYARTKPFLRDAAVDIYLIVRETRRNVQQPPLYDFWLKYFAASDGFLRYWEPLQ